MSSMWQNKLKLSIFGESHGAGIGMVLDNLPSGFCLDLDKLSAFTRRRVSSGAKPGTPRKEADIPEFLSGLKDNTTCGTPLAAIIRNTNTRSGDYALSDHLARPGHADYTGHLRYEGFNDIAGGGHFSGRLTAPLVLAGGICKQILASKGVTVGAHLFSVGEVQDNPFDPVAITAGELEQVTKKPMEVCNDLAAEQMRQVIDDARRALDSVGGVVECAAVGLPAGIGSPIFDGLENRIASLLFGIPGVKGLEFGDGFETAKQRGSQQNDPFYMDGQTVKTKTNHHGGILGGISSGMPILLRAAFKPTPSIAQQQDTVDYHTLTDAKLIIQGRHDPCIAVRAVVCVEAAVCIALLDALLESCK